MKRSWKVSQQESPATYAIWQDPSSYDPARHGPPYLPPPKTARTAGLASDVLSATGYETVYDALPAILVLLRAVAIIHQTNHWSTHGPTYYADHLLFERLYNDLADEIDSVAERAVGSGQGKKIADARAQMSGVQRVVAMLYPADMEDGSSETYVETSLRAETFFLECMKDLTSKMKDQGTLTRGTDDLLAGIEDKHEEHTYLLKQRIADEWKAV